MTRQKERRRRLRGSLSRSGKSHQYCAGKSLRAARVSRSESLSSAQAGPIRTSLPSVQRRTVAELPAPGRDRKTLPPPTLQADSAESGQPRLAKRLLDAGPVEGADHRFADDAAAEQHSLNLKRPRRISSPATARLRVYRSAICARSWPCPSARSPALKLWNAEIKGIALGHNYGSCLGLGLVGSTTSRLGRIQGHSDITRYHCQQH
jgi:hypothetical protein